MSIDDFWPDEWDIVIISLQVGFKGADGIFLTGGTKLSAGVGGGLFESETKKKYPHLHIHTQPWHWQSRKQVKMTQKHIQAKASTDKLCELKQNKCYAKFTLHDFNPNFSIARQVLINRRQMPKIGGKSLLVHASYNRAVWNIKDVSRSEGIAMTYSQWESKIQGSGKLREDLFFLLFTKLLMIPIYKQHAYILALEYTDQGRLNEDEEARVFPVNVLL